MATKRNCRIIMHGEAYNLRLDTSTYADSTALAVVLKELDGSPFACLSVNTDMSGLLPEHHFYAKTYSENTGFLEQLEEQGLVQRSALPALPSGFVTLPIYRLLV